MNAHRPPQPRRVGLVGCSARKLDRRAPAAELYVGPLFVKASAYAAKTCETWHVLSALHGLVDPSTELDPYDVTMRGVKAKWEPGPWAAAVNMALVTRYNDATPTVFYVLAGAAYRTPLVPLLSAWSEPRELLAGLGIGEQLAALDSAIRAHS